MASTPALARRGLESNLYENGSSSFAYDGVGWNNLVAAHRQVGMQICAYNIIQVQTDVLICAHANKNNT